LWWATWAIDTWWSIDCSRITNPVTAWWLYLQTSSLCDNRWFIDSWTWNIANNYRYGSNISPQIQTVQWSWAGIFLYWIAWSTYDTWKYIWHYWPVWGTFSIENNTWISYTTWVLLYTTIAWASQMNFSNNWTARSILESYNWNKSWTLEWNTPWLKIVYADFSGSNWIFMAADTIDLILPPTVSTWYISLWTTWIHWNTWYYTWIIDIQADTSTPGAMSGCEYTTGLSRAIADYNWSSISWYCYKTWLHYTSDITINFRAIDYNGHVWTWIPTTYIYDETPPTFTFTNSSGDECVTWSLEITNAVDTWIWLHLYPYNFSYNPNLRDNNQAKIITGQQAWEITTIPWWIRDAFWNSTQIQTSTYTFNDVVPTADNFTYWKNIWNSIKTWNWKILSSASEWSCGNLDLSFSGILTNWTKWICNIAWDIITYNPSPEQTWSDNCTIQIKDNENSTTNITITWVNINTSTPIITNVASDKDNWSYWSGEIIDINVQFSEAVKVTWIPKLKLNTNPIRTWIYIDMWLFDMTFDSWSWFDRDVYTTAIQHDGKILVGGIFQTYNNTPANKIIRLNTDWSRDDTFNILNGFDNNRVNKILIQNDGKILVWGSFTWYNWILANRIIRLNADWSRDETFDIWNWFDWYVHTMAIQDDGKILVWGNFSNYQSYTYNKIIRLNPDGSRDTTFSNNNLFLSSYPINTIAIQNDGKILVWGDFYQWWYVQTNRIIRLDYDGSQDTSFDVWTWFDNNVEKILIQNDGKILVWGQFSWYKWTPANRIIRLNTGWSIDTSFDIWSGFNWTIITLNIQNDDKILVWGGFTSYKWTPANRIIRLNTDWSIDTSFDLSNVFDTSFTWVMTGFYTWFLWSTYLSDISIQKDGNIIVWGNFQNFNSTNKGIARLSEYNSNQTFRYTVQTWDISSDLDYTDINALNLDGWTIQDIYAYNANILLFTTWAVWSLWFNKDLVIGTTTFTPPTVSTWIISIWTTGNNWPTLYYQWSVTIKADVNSWSHALSGATCEYTTWLSRAPAIYNTTHCTAIWTWTDTLTIRFRIADISGNVTTWATGTYIYDATASTIPTLISPIAWPIFTTTPSLNWDPSTDVWIGMSGYYYQLSTDNTFVALTQQWTWSTNSWNPTVLNNWTTYYWRVRSFDTFYNTSIFSTTWQFTVSTITPPTVSTWIISIWTTGNNWPTLYYQWSVTIKADVNSWSHALSGATCEYTTWLSRAPAIYNTTHCTAIWTWTDTLTIRFRIADISGNVTTWATGTYIYDATPPVWWTFVINNGLDSTASTSVTLNTTCPTDSWIWWTQIAFWNTQNPTNRQTCSASLSHTLLAWEGIKTVYMRAQDTLWNITADYTDTITLDISNPIVTGNYPTSWLSISNWHTVIFDRSWSDTNMSWYTLYVNGDSYTTIATNYTINNISNGNYTWHVVATDRAWNTGTSTHIPFSIATSLSPIMKLLTWNLHYTTARYTKDYVALSLWTNTSANYIFTGDFSTPTPPFMWTWLNGAMTGNFILTTGDGIKNIYLQVSDGIITTGKTFVSYLDTTAPSIPTLISPISGGIATGAFTLARSTSSDTGVWLSGYQYFLSRTGTFATLIKSWFTSTPSTTLTDGEIWSSGTFYWYIKTIDTLGNSWTSATQSFSYTGTLDTQPNAFVLNTLTGVLTNRIYWSNTITIAWLSANTPVLASIDRWTLFINGTMVGTTWYVQNWSTVKIELVSSNSYNTLVTSTLNIWWISSSFRITTESEDEDTNLSKTTKLWIIAIFNSIKNLYTGEKQYEFLDSFMIMLQSKIDDLGTNSNNTHIYKALQYMYTLVEKYRDTLIGDPDIFNVPWIINNIYTAPNGKKYTITFDAIKRQFTSPNFLTPQYFITLNALKYIIDLHNPAWSRYLSSKPIKARWGNIHIDWTRQTSPYIAPNRKVFYFFKTMEGKISSYTFTVEKYFNDLHSAKEFLHNTNLR